MTSPDAQAELKPCPFCGSSLSGLEHGAFGHEIGAPDCILSYTAFDASDIERWNTRTPDAQPSSESRCDDCGGVNPVWFAPNALWNLVIGGPEAKGDPGGFVCPVCFIKRAEAGGLRSTAWELRPERHD